MKDVDNYRKPEIRYDGDEINVELQWPRIEGHIAKVIVELCDVRAADGVRVSYDFARDGWRIEQAQRFSWDWNDSVCDPGWIEVAFVQAWASKISHPNE